MNWSKSFGKCQPELGATPSQIDQFIASVCAPLTEAEITELWDELREIVGEDGSNFDPPYNPAIWVLPELSMPACYLDFLRWSNGGYFEGQFRDLDPLFSTVEVRDYMLGYSLPHWMPRSLPIGFDGGGGFYVLDMRAATINGDYPVLWSHAMNLGYEEAKPIAPSFQEFITSGLGPQANS